MRALALTALTIALALPSSATPTPPGRNGLIAFVSHTYTSEVGNGIAVVRPDGSHLRKLTRNARDRSPAWSPDGKRLAFARGGQIYTVKPDSSGLRRLTNRPGGNGEPAWSPDARSIAFTRRGALFVMRADGRDQRAVFRASGRVVDRPSWSPDGKWIAFGLTEDGPGSIVVVSRAGGEPRYLTDGRVEPDENTDPNEWPDDRAPDWSPDGTLIAFTRTVWLCPRCDQDAVFSIAADGSDVRGLTGTEYASSRPAWSPDGSWFVAETSDGLALFTDSAARVRIVDRSGTEPAWQPLRRAS